MKDFDFNKNTLHVGDLTYFLGEEDGKLHLKCRNNTNGDVWYIVAITESGRLFKHTSIGRNIGLSLDDAGRIINE